MARISSVLLVFAAALGICLSKIVTLDCSNTVVPGKVNGEFSEACIINHAFKNGDATNWNFAKSKVRSTTFTDIEFKGDQDFSNTLWDQVTFKGCTFSGKSTNLFKNGEAKNLIFEGCTFAASADMMFQSMSLSAVSFKNCAFQNNWILKESTASGLVFEGCSAGGAGKSIAFDSATVNGVSITKTAMTSPLKFLSADITALSIGDNSTMAEFHCGQVSGDSMSRESTFKNAKISGLTLANMRCSQSTWSGISLHDVTYEQKIDFAGTTLSRVNWDGISTHKGSASSGSCGLIDVSYSQISNGESISGLQACNITFKGTKFTDPVDFSGVETTNDDVVSFRDATFTQVCVGNSSCVSMCGKPSEESRTCTCASDADSTECKKEGSNVDEDINEDIIDSNSTKSKKKNDSSCFPADATVTLESGENIKMTDLRHSHRVAVGSGDHSDVYFFGHRDENAETEYIHISTSGKNELRISPGHYIYVNGKLATARTVRTGDKLETWNEKKVVVTSVRRVVARGKFAPTTLHGNIMVDGIVVSSYTDAIHPRVAHTMLAPLRSLYVSRFSFLTSRFSLLHKFSAAPVAKIFGLAGPEDLTRTST